MFVNVQQQAVVSQVIESDPMPFAQPDRNNPFGCYSSIIDHIKDSPLKKRLGRGRNNNNDHFMMGTYPTIQEDDSPDSFHLTLGNNSKSQ